MPTWVIPVLMQIPQIATAIGALLKSPEIQSIEQAFEAFFNHNTPGQPNSPALGPEAPPAA